MKKLTFILLLVLTLALTGCGGDKAYIETVKGIVTAEEILGANNIEDLSVELIRKCGENPAKNDIKWLIEGETKDGKMVVAEYNNNKVFIPTIKNGDYVEIMPINIYVINSQGKRFNLVNILIEDAFSGFNF